MTVIKYIWISFIILLVSCTDNLSLKDTVHGKTKSSDVFKTITDLLNVKLEENIGMKDGKFHHWYKQVEGTAPNGTKFYRIDNKNVE